MELNGHRLLTDKFKGLTFAKTVQNSLERARLGRDRGLLAEYSRRHSSG